MRQLLCGRILPVIVGLGLLLSILTFYAQFPRAHAQATTLPATQDTLVDPNNPATSFNGQRLETTYSNFPSFAPTRRSLLQFSLSGTSSSLSNSSLILQLVENNLPAGANVNLGLYSVADAWSEATVTANSEPVLGSLLQTVNVAAGFTGQVRFDVTAVGAYSEAQRIGDGVASFLLRLDDGSGSLGFGGNLLFEDHEGTADGVNGNEPAVVLPDPITPTVTSTPIATASATPVVTTTQTATAVAQTTATPGPTATVTPTGTPQPRIFLPIITEE